MIERQADQLGCRGMRRGVVLYMNPREVSNFFRKLLGPAIWPPSDRETIPGFSFTHSRIPGKRRAKIRRGPSPQKVDPTV